MDVADHADDQTLPFQEPGRFLGALDPATVARIVASAADVALIIEGGVVRDVALGNEELLHERRDRAWRDKPWIETVTIESRPKIEDLLRTKPADGPRWRQVNHPSHEGADLPVNYTAVRADRDHLVVLGRDLRSISRLQQRLVEAHQELERDYARLREAESRYRLLFQSVSQPVLIVNPTTLEIEEANPAAAGALGQPVQSLVGAAASESFARRSRGDVERLAAEAMSLGNASATNLRLADGTICGASASAFRQDQGARVILRLETEAGAPGGTPGGDVLRILEELPDGLIVVGPELRVLTANRAFVEMTHLVHQGQVAGSRLADFLGRSPTELNVLVSNLKSHGVVKNFTTVLRDRTGGEEVVEVSAVATPMDAKTIYGFSVRGVARRLRTGAPASPTAPGSGEQLTHLVGRMPLREIVRESTDFIEKLCIEAALEITGDNRASAAEMLGLSRQSLYSKLKRFGIDES